MTNFSFPIVIADIGGTNARFRVVEQPNAPPIEFDSVRTADFQTIEDALRETVLEKGYRPRTALIAAAGPIQPNGLNLTNCHWNIDAPDFLDRLRLERLVLFNDFDAQALALPFLTQEDVITLGDVSLDAANRTKAVLGPGTGLGVAGLARTQSQWVPIGGEGGHVDLGPRTDRERAIWPHLETVQGRISAEQVLSGDGLLNLYRAICLADGIESLCDTAAEVSQSGLQGQSNAAAEALDIFAEALGRVAGDLALTVMARGGVFISGGIAGHILPVLEKGMMRSAFDDKAPHGELMRSIGLHIVTRDLPALLGLERFASAPDAFAISLEHRSWDRL